MASTDPPESRHRIKVRILVVLASILAFLAIFTSWVDRQALDTNEWVNTSGKLLEDKAISDAVATYAVDQLYANVDVSAVIKQRLPRDLQPFSAPVVRRDPPVRHAGGPAGDRVAAGTAGLEGRKPDRPPQLVSILKGNNEAVRARTARWCSTCGHWSFSWRIGSG